MAVQKRGLFSSAGILFDVFWSDVIWCSVLWNRLLFSGLSLTRLYEKCSRVRGRRWRGSVHERKHVCEMQLWMNKEKRKWEREGEFNSKLEEMVVPTAVVITHSSVPSSVYPPMLICVRESEKIEERENERECEQYVWECAWVCVYVKYHHFGGSDHKTTSEPLLSSPTQ